MLSTKRFLGGNHPSAEGKYSDRFSFRRSLIGEQGRRICVALGSINDEKCAQIITGVQRPSYAANPSDWRGNLTVLHDFPFVSHDESEVRMASQVTIMFQNARTRQRAIIPGTAPAA
jgi:hypothetical protein